MTVIQLPRLEFQALDAANLAQASDFVQQNHRSFYHDHLPAKMLQQNDHRTITRHLEQTLGSSWLARLDQTIVGLISVTANCVDDLWVAQQYRRRGIGKRLVDIALDQVSNRGYCSAQTGVEDFNTVAGAFFRQLGWRIIGAQTIAIEPGRHVDALVYSKALQLTVDRVKSA